LNEQTLDLSWRVEFKSEMYRPSWRMRKSVTKTKGKRVEKEMGE
jgi:hypothetical protein